MLKILGISLLYGLISTASASVTSATQTASGTVTASAATCPSRTANVITHNLPQQCLTSTWKNTESAALDATGSYTNLPASPSFAANVSESLYDNVANLSTTTEAASSPLENIQTSTKLTAESSSQSSTGSILVESDDASPLDDGQFMSFEEWKKQNLQKAGQSEHLGRDSPAEPLPQRKRPANIHAALDTIGDDAEIDLDFAGFMPDASGLIGPVRGATDADPQQDLVDAPLPNTPKVKSRSRDAGTTCKERFNYASFDCAANVLKWNPEATSWSAVLGENKDSYMLNVCSAENKFLILELCNDISIDTIVLANYEFFSSIFRTFRVSVSDKYPVKADKWKSLGTFEARNTREVQAFLVENPVMWARYLRIEFLTHYGHEYYCPVSLVRVHGTTMLEDYKHDLESAQAEAEGDREPADLALPPEDAFVPDAVADPVLQRDVGQDPHDEVDRGFNSEKSQLSESAEDSAAERNQGSYSASPSIADAANHSASHGLSHPSEPISGSSRDRMGFSASTSGVNASDTTTTSRNKETHSSGSTARQSVPNTQSEPIANSSTSQTASNSSQRSSGPSNSTQVNSVSGSSTNTTTSDRARSSGTATSSQPATPTMQESFFKSFQKRLQMLESNASLSLQYIEDQSRALRDAFNKVEQRQLSKTTSFLDQLNSTVLSELREFRQQYDQLWQSTVIELEMQRERYHHETEAMNARLGILADELIFQKRISILQMMLVLICLALVLFTKGTFNQYLELPLVQSVLARSPSSRWLNAASLDTPTQSPPATRQSSLRKRHGILKGHRRVQSEDSIEGSMSPNDMYSPPTPVSMSYGEPSDGEQVKEQSAAMDDPEFDPSTIERPSTSPPELSGVSPEFGDLNGDESIESRLVGATLESGTSSPVPRVVVEEATPPPKQLSWRLPDSP